MSGVRLAHTSIVRTANSVTIMKNISIPSIHANETDIYMLKHGGGHNVRHKCLRSKTC